MRTFVLLTLLSSVLTLQKYRSIFSMIKKILSSTAANASTKS